MAAAKTKSKKNLVLGIDIGGSGIKGALVNIDTGKLHSERYRLETPKPSTPKKVGEALDEIVDYFSWKGVVGCTFPAIIKKGVALSAANIHKDWLNTNVEKLVKKHTGRKNLVVNDADAAGVAEMLFGAGRKKQGTVMILTFGTGIGSSVFVDGRLHPNTEMGHIKFEGGISEHYVNGQMIKKKNITWAQWRSRVKNLLNHFDLILNPDLFIIGGGISREKYVDNWVGKIKIPVPYKPAKLQNNAGIIGAAYLAYKKFDD